MAVLAIGAHFMLGLYDTPKNHFIYSHLGTVPLWLLVIGYIPQMPRAQFIAVSRATNRVGQAAGLICFFASCEIASIFIGGRLGGLDGLSFAYLGVLIMEGLITAPTVLRAAYAVTHRRRDRGLPGRRRAGAATGALARSGPLARVTGELVKLTGSCPRCPARPTGRRTASRRCSRSPRRRSPRTGTRLTWRPRSGGPARSRPSRPTPPGRGRCSDPRRPPASTCCGGRMPPRRDAAAAG